MEKTGIIQRATEAREKTEEATLEEKIKLLTAESIINEYTGESEEKTAQELQDELNNQGENVLVIQWDKYIIFDLDKNKEYRVMSDGSLEYWGESTMGQTLLNTKIANADQISQDPSTSNIIGIDNDGNTVNMLLWERTLIDDSSLGKVGTYGLNDKNGLDGSGKLGRSAGYIGSYTEDGRILGTVPAYISEDGGKTYISVTSMAHTFYDCDNLVIAPEIADTVTNMQVTFYQSSNLTTAPSKIPDSVRNLSYTFSNCSNLIEVPTLGRNVVDMTASFGETALTKFETNLPEGIINMSYTFYGCTSLKEFNVDIPNSVTNLSNTFYNTALTSFDVKISNNVTTISGAFIGCTNLTEFNTKLPSSVTNMQNTFSNCTNLVIGPNIIPESVTNMFQTFRNCNNLKGTMQINANLDGKIVFQYNGVNYKDYEQCFENASTNGDGLIISKDSTCSELESLINTKSINSNITLGE